MPLVLSVLPILGLSFMAHGTFERAMLAVTLACAVISSCWGLRIHRSSWVALLFFIAISLLGLSRACSGAAHGMVLGLGGLMLSVGHVFSRRLCRSCHSCDHHVRAGHVRAGGERP
ncbi:MAG TPA: MerC family mercury resistance protein [Planctomycetota bacterium]|nr:MerC family mercury resistance protein [Planctomycetota bacterium]